MVSSLEIKAGKLAVYGVFWASVAFALLFGFLADGETSFSLRLSDFITIWISILLEAFPFLLLGTLLSSLIHLFVTPTLIAKFVPKGTFTSLLGASLIGFAFPICECANVPVTRRLLTKGFPTHAAVTFLLAVAIVNPVVLFSTWIAFGGDLRMVLLRGLLGMGISIFVGWLFSVLPGFSHPLRSEKEEAASPSEASCEECGHAHPSTPGTHGHEHGREGNVVVRVLSHTMEEFYGVGRYLILGAGVASLMQTILPRTTLVQIGSSPLLSVLTLMALAYTLSLCSEADAFIAATFAGYFTPGSIVAFLVYGPMMDVKNTLMLSQGFKPKFIAFLITAVTLSCVVVGLGVNAFFPKG